MTVGENNYEWFRLEKRIFYANYWYTKQAILQKLSHEMPDVANTFGLLTKEDTSHGFPMWRPMERNSDWALYNINSEGWFQVWSVIASVVVVAMWFWMADYQFNINSSGYDDEDLLRFRDHRATIFWERTFWSFTYYIHG